jgi:hypothetical protein
MLLLSKSHEINPSDGRWDGIELPLSGTRRQLPAASCTFVPVQ